MPKHKKIEPSTQTITENAENLNTVQLPKIDIDVPCPTYKTTPNYCYKLINLDDNGLSGIWRYKLLNPEQFPNLPASIPLTEANKYPNIKFPDTSFIGEYAFKNIIIEKPNDWKSKINPRHIVLFKDKKDEIEKKYSKDFWVLQKEIQEGKVNFLDVDEKYLLVKLAGWRELAQLREYESIKYEVYSPSPQYCAVQCLITWKNNDASYTEFSSLADAHLGNTFSFAQNFLLAIAENRAFCRAVRNFLNISIVSYEEMGPNSDNKNGNAIDEDTSPSNQQLLKNSVKDILQIDSFENFKDFLRKEKNDGNISFEPSEIKAIKDANDIDELPSLFCVTLLRLVKSKQKSN